MTTLSTWTWSFELFALAYHVGAGRSFGERRIIEMGNTEPAPAGLVRGLFNRAGFRVCYLAGRAVRAWEGR